LKKENGDEFANVRNHRFHNKGFCGQIYCHTFYCKNRNYDMIYLGSFNDSDKEANAIKGVEKHVQEAIPTPLKLLQARNLRQ